MTGFTHVSFLLLLELSLFLFLFFFRNETNTALQLNTVEQMTLRYIVHNINIVFIVLPFCASAARMCHCDLICWDKSFFPPDQILKLVWHTLQKAWVLFTWLRDKKLNSSVQLLLNLYLD